MLTVDVDLLGILVDGGVGLDEDGGVGSILDALALGGTEMLRG